MHNLIIIKALLVSMFVLGLFACQSEQLSNNPSSSIQKAAPVEKKVQTSVEAQTESISNLDIDYSGSKENAKEEIAQFNAFIQHFIGAVKANNIEKVKSLTYFPFDTKGMTQGHLILSYSAADFLSIFTAFIKQDLGLDLDDPMLSQHLDKYIELNKKISIGNYNARLGDMRFQKKRNEWKFTWVYLNDKTISSLSHIQPEKARQE